MSEPATGGADSAVQAPRACGRSEARGYPSASAANDTIEASISHSTGAMSSV